jgi:hypothetical protein
MNREQKLLAAVFFLMLFKIVFLPGFIELADFTKAYFSKVYYSKRNLVLAKENAILAKANMNELRTLNAAKDFLEKTMQDNNTQIISAKTTMKGFKNRTTNLTIEYSLLGSYENLITSILAVLNSSYSFKIKSLLFKVQDQKQLVLFLKLELLTGNEKELL